MIDTNITMFVHILNRYLSADSPQERSRKRALENACVRALALCAGALRVREQQLGRRAPHHHHAVRRSFWEPAGPSCARVCPVLLHKKKEMVRPFSAVSAPIFTITYSLLSILRDLKTDLADFFREDSNASID